MAAIEEILVFLGRVLRPVAKEAIKLGIKAYDGVSEAVSTAGGAASDLVNEARAEAAAAGADAAETAKTRPGSETAPATTGRGGGRRKRGAT